MLFGSAQMRSTPGGAAAGAPREPPPIASPSPSPWAPPCAPAGDARSTMARASVVASAAPRSTSTGRVPRVVLPITGASEREDVDHTARGGVLRQIGHGAGRPERGRGVVGRETERDRAQPAADPGVHGHVLFPVRPHVRDGIPDDPGPTLELPEHLPTLRVDRLEPSVHRAVEQDVAGGDDRAAPEI